MDLAPSDHALLVAARGGDPDMFGVFYRRHGEVILGYAARRLRDREAAADLMAEVFAAALVVVRDPGRPLPATPIAWLFTVAQNLIIDYHRHGRVESAGRRRLGLQPIALDDHDLERIGEIAEAAGLIGDVTDRLSDAEWTMLRARLVDGESYRSLAGRLRCSEDVVRKRVSRAIAHLRTAMEGNHV